MTLPIESGRITVGTTPIQIDGVGVSPVRLILHNESNDKNLYIGNGNVSVLNGFALAKSSVLDITIFPSQSLWIVAEAAGHVVSYLRIPV